MPPAGYYSNVNPDLLRFIPPDAKSVLEIGCGEGALCEAYRRVNPGVLWFGIDCNQDALDEAPDEMQTRCADLNQSFGARDFMSESLERDIECVIFGDVLEHLIDPTSCLKVCTEHVKPGAHVLACIPNVQHWTVIRDLLAGKWEYQDSGLLDRTHLRFFTLDSIRKMFAEAGLQVFEIVGRDICNEGYNEWLNREMGDQVYHDKQFLAYQYVVRALKPVRYPFGEETVHPIAARPKLHIHAVTAEACCTRPRILEPFAMMGAIPGVTCTTSPNSALPDAPVDIMIVQRPRTFSMHFWQAMLEAGRTIVIELDDLPKAIGISPTTLKAVHAIQVSTEPLAEICRQHNPNVMVFPNQIAELLPVKELYMETSPMRIFCGWQNRESDWRPILSALNRILRQEPTHRVVVVHDREFFDELHGHPDYREFHPFLPYDQYRAVLRSCDIALLPLEDTPFNRCKSDVKFLECAAEGVCAIAGPLEHERLCNIDQVTCAPKDDRLKNGVYVFGYNNAATFDRALRGAIEDAAYRREVAENAYYYVSKYRLLSQHFRRHYDWYQSLLAAKPNLDRQLLERVPELSGRLATA